MSKEESNYLWPELHVNHSQSIKRGKGEVGMILAVNWPLSMSDFCVYFSLNGSSGRMCQVSSLPTGEEILVPSSGSWGNAGMGVLTEFLTFNTSEYHSDVEECSLWDILEDAGDVPQECYLTDHNKKRIAQRLSKYGKVLPATRPGTVWGWTGDETPKFAEDCSPTLRAGQGGEGAGVWFPDAGDVSPPASGNV